MEDYGTLLKIEPLYKYLTENFRNTYSSGKESFLDEGMIPWRGQLKFKTYNLRKIVKYYLLVTQKHMWYIQS